MKSFDKNEHRADITKSSTAKQTLIHSSRTVVGLTCDVLKILALLGHSAASKIYLVSICLNFGLSKALRAPKEILPFFFGRLLGVTLRISQRSLQPIALSSVLVDSNNYHSAVFHSAQSSYTCVSIEFIQFFLNLSDPARLLGIR